MARLTRCKDGRICLEVQGDVDSITDHEGTVSFVYLSPTEADGLYVALGQELIDDDFKRMEKQRVMPWIKWPF